MEILGIFLRQKKCGLYKKCDNTSSAITPKQHTFSYIFSDNSYMINLFDAFTYLEKNRALLCFTQASKRYISNYPSAAEVYSKSKNKSIKLANPPVFAS
jgi:hypothetical protein